ncbi:MAG: ABC transporter permease [Holophaga sp.]|nr:ABC transporter permease [Holophaga sp.]
MPLGYREPMLTKAHFGLERLTSPLGGGLWNWLARLGSIAWLSVLCFRQLFSLRANQLGLMYDQTKLQVRFTALDALPLALLTALLLGGITLIQVFAQMSAFGAETYLSQLLAQLVIRELGPLLVSVIVIGRSGTAIAAEMASIKLSGDVDALCAMGVNPIQYLLLPRILGGVISVFSLIIIFDAAALLGGFLLAWSRLPLSPSFFFHALGNAIQWHEIIITFAKATIFGGLIPLICLSSGLRVQSSSTEIPQAVTAAAVSSLVAVFLVGAFLSVLVYG